MLCWLSTSDAGVQVQVQNCCFFCFLFVGDFRYINKYFLILNLLLV